MKSEGLFDVQKLLCNVLKTLGKEGNEIRKHLAEGHYAAIAARPMPAVTNPDFPRAYAAWSLLRKSMLLIGDTKVLQQAAFRGFAATEHSCHTINNHSGVRATDSVSKSIGESIIMIAQEKIASVLGELSSSEFLDSCAHTGGASTQRKRTSSSMKNKWSDPNHVTCEALPLLEAVNLHLNIASNGHKLVVGAEAFTVPKDAKTDRLIFKEPQGNMFLQKSLGTMIRRRLKRVGIDLNDQSINQKLAGDLGNATVDLSNASNLISRSTVALLLQRCPDWLSALEICRSPRVNIDGSFKELEMFSGMGNGFTFELESLLFYALAWASDKIERDMNCFTGPQVISVYGDDIIVRHEVYDTLCVGLHYCGFEVNVLKSYAAGPFRESCGKHYLNGRDITPVHLKSRKFQHLADYYYLHNQLQDLNSRLCNSALDQVVRAMRNVFSKKGVLNYVPPSYANDSGVHAPFDVARPTRFSRPRNRRKPWVQGYSATVLRQQTDTYRVCEKGSYYAAVARKMLMPLNQRCDLRVLALMGVHDVSPPVIKVYRKGTASESMTQGERYNTGQYIFSKVEIPSGCWS